MSTKGYYKSRLRSKGQITLPGDIRELLNVNEGDDLVFWTNEEGQVIVDRARVVSPDQAWFWTERWQRMEREAQADIEAGRVIRHANIDEAISGLEKLNDGGDRTD